jgi:ATP phosphoribosyltransferase regulatory subunit
VESDLEILCLMMETLTVAGVENVFLDLGHVGIFRGLAHAAGVNREQEQALFNALQRKAVPEIEGLVSAFSLPARQGRWFVVLAGLNGRAGVLEQAPEQLEGAPDEVLDAIEYLRRAGEMLEQCMPDLPVHYDLAELRGYQYQNGLVFAAFVPGSGKEIARGARYDDIGGKFGRARPATGFSADLKTLMRFGRQPGGKRECVFAPWKGGAGLESLVAEMRRHGIVVVRQLPGQYGDARAAGCTHELVPANGGWEKRALD